MTDRDRALDYIRIFINVGDRWRDYVPVDGDLTDTVLRLGTVEVWPGEDNTWWLDDGNSRSCFVAKRVAS